MRFNEFVGGSYNSSSPLVDQEQSMNLFPELIAGDGGSGETWILKRAPGQRLLLTLPDSPVRGMYQTQDRLFVVSGYTFYEITLTGATQPVAGVPSQATVTATVRGTLTAGGVGNPVIMKASPVEICIIADISGYIFNLSTNVFTKITAPAFPASASALAMIDTYFIVKSAANQFSISGPLNGLSWSALDFGSTQEPDTIVALAELHLSLWVYGRKRIVIFQNTGAASFPFQRVPGGVLDVGLAAAYSVQNLDNTLFWIGSSEAGFAVVYRADGLLPTRVSNHALEWYMHVFNAASAISSTYQEEGHMFYRLDFPGGTTPGQTWLYDVSTKRWHQRGLWNAGTSTYGPEPARYHASFLSGFHIVGDYRSGALYQQNMDTADWAGLAIRWFRRCPHIVDGNRVRMFYRSLEVVFGVAGAAASAVTMALRWSDDGGNTWPAAHSQVQTLPGQYTPRTVFRRLGSARSRVFELAGSDPLPRLSIAGADLQIEKGTS